MKKFLALALILGLMAPGCAGFGKFSTGAQAVVDFVCAPTEAEKAEAAKWLAAVDSIQSGVTVFFPALALVKASSAMAVLAAGGCFVLDQVETALNLLQSMQTEQAKMLMAKAAPRTSAQQFPALWARVQGK